MQLKYLFSIAVLSFGLLLSTAAFSSPASSAKLTWTSLSETDMLIDVTLPSGVEVRGVRYRKRPIMDDWYLEIQSETGSIQHILETTIHSSHGEVKNLSAQDFNDLFIAVIPFIKHNNNGQLDGVHLDLGLVTELWEDTASFLRQGVVPSNYRLKAKDRDLAHQISVHLRSSSILKKLCEAAAQLQKTCEDNFVGMNPVTFESEYIGKEWQQVEMLPNTGMPIDRLWFELSLIDIAN